MVAGYTAHALGMNASGWLVGIALTTTALGTLVPILSDAGVLSRPVGGAVLGTGVSGEFWPIVVISVFLTGTYGAGTGSSCSSSSGSSSRPASRPRSGPGRRGSCA